MWRLRVCVLCVLVRGAGVVLLVCAKQKKANSRIRRERDTVKADINKAKAEMLSRASRSKSELASVESELPSHRARMEHAATGKVLMLVCCLLSLSNAAVDTLLSPFACCHHHYTTITNIPFACQSHFCIHQAPFQAPRFCAPESRRWPVQRQAHR